MRLRSTWLSRFGSSCFSKFFLHRAWQLSHRFRGPRFYGAPPSGGKERLLSGSRSLVPFAIVASAGGVLALELRPTSSLDRSIEWKERTGLLVQGPHKELPEEFIKELRTILQGNMTLEYDERHFHGNPHNSFHRAVNIPDVIVYPRSHDDVQKIVISCNKYKVPIVPYGGATSLEGQTLAPNGGVCIDMSSMKIRKEALWACLAMAPNFESLTTDVCVPLSRLAECISQSKQELNASPLLCMVVAHAGDGNFHACILFDPDQDEQRQEAERLNHFIVHTALSMEGTCTGEHGVGTSKMKYLEEELGLGALITMKRIKAALDPNNIMNPGKLIPPHVCF